jgi:hypothetical protein
LQQVNLGLAPANCVKVRDVERLHAPSLIAGCQRKRVTGLGVTGLGVTVLDVIGNDGLILGTQTGDRVNGDACTKVDDANKS